MKSGFVPNVFLTLAPVLPAFLSEQRFLISNFERRRRWSQILHSFFMSVTFGLPMHGNQNSFRRTKKEVLEGAQTFGIRRVFQLPGFPNCHPNRQAFAARLFENVCFQINSCFGSVTFVWITKTLRYLMQCRKHNITPHEQEHDC